MPKRGNTKFQSSWSTEFTWVGAVENNVNEARCELCKKNFSVDSMGRQAVVSHSKSKKHRQAFNATAGSSVLPISTFFNNVIPSSNGASTSNTDADDMTEAAASTGKLLHTEPNFRTLKEKTLYHYLEKDAITKREIIWCLGTVVNHDSLRNSEEKISLFKLMFTEVAEVQQLELSKTKISYVINYGLGPYFKSELEIDTKSCSFYVFGFDESLNKISQKQQMDVTVRYWNSSKNEVSSRYLTSVFLGHSTAEDLLLAFRNAVSGYDKEKILQLSMDGPNVNFKLFRLLKEELKAINDGNGPELLDMGSCGIHTMHCAFKSGIKATAWELIEFLRAIYNLFKNIPSRRSDYIKISGSPVFPLKFCAVRWLENGKVAQRAEMVLPNLKIYVETISKDKKNKPKCKSFDVIEKIIKDPLLPAKLAFFRSVAEEIEPFLREYQTDSPLAPFLYDSLTVILHNILERLIKSDVFKTQELTKIDLNNKDNFKRYQDYDLGYATREALRNCSKNVKEIDVLRFRKESMICLKLVAQKILERSPLKYRLTKAISCLNPTTVVSNGGAVIPLRSALEILVRGNRLSGRTADCVEREFKALCAQETVKLEMQNYSRAEERLDHFWFRILKDDERWHNLRQFLPTILILSHGNANLERGFSINKECLAENLQQQSLIAQRHVYDAVSAAGGISKIVISKALIHSARNAYSKYKDALLQKRKDDENLRRQYEEKKKKAEEKRKLVAKKVKLLQEIEEKKVELREINEKVLF